MIRFFFQNPAFYLYYVERHFRSHCMYSTILEDIVPQNLVQNKDGVHTRMH